MLALGCHLLSPSGRPRVTTSACLTSSRWSRMNHRRPLVLDVRRSTAASALRDRRRRRTHELGARAGAHRTRSASGGCSALTLGRLFRCRAVAIDHAGTWCTQRWLHDLLQHEHARTAETRRVRRGRGLAVVARDRVDTMWARISPQRFPEPRSPTVTSAQPPLIRLPVLGRGAARAAPPQRAPSMLRGGSLHQGADPRALRGGLTRPGGTPSGWSPARVVQRARPLLNRQAVKAQRNRPGVAPRRSFPSRSWFPDST